MDSSQSKGNMDSQTLITGLIKEEYWAFEKLYREHFDPIKRFVLRNSGTLDDAKDLFQDTAIALIKVISKEDFSLNENTKLSTLSYSIGRRLWFMKLRKKKVPIAAQDISEMNKDFDDGDLGLIEKVEYEKKHQLIADALLTMGEECRKLLAAYYFKNIQLKKIAEMMAYTQAFVRVKKNRCMNELRRKVINKS